jgi:hypothetical protein
MRLFKCFFCIHLICIFIKSNAQNMGVKLPVSTLPNTTLDVNGSTAFREGTAISLTNPINDNVVLGDYSFYRIIGATAAFSITGFDNGQNGRVLFLINATAFNLTLSNLNASSDLDNRINTGSGTNLTLTPSGSATLIYNATLQKWAVFSKSGELNKWDLNGNSGTTPGTHFIGTTDPQALVFKTNDTEGMRLSTGQNLSIGAASPLSTARLHVENTGSNYAFYAPTSTNRNYLAGNTAFGGYSSNPNDISLLWGSTATDNAMSLQKDFTSFTAGTLYRGISALMRLSPSGNISNLIHGVTNDIQTNAASTGNFTSLIRGVGADFRHYGSGTVSEVEGFNTHVGNYGLGTITNAYGIQAHVARISGTITNNYGGYFKAEGGATTNYGIYASTNNSATNNYLYYGNVTGGGNTDWGMYITGEDKNYFSSLVGIGTTDPAAALHVSSSQPGLYNDILLSGYHNVDVPIFNIRRARGTEASPANLVNGDGLGGNHYYGYVNGGWNYLSGVHGRYKGNSTTTLSSLEFLTSNSVRMTLDENGRLGINETTPQNTLDVGGNMVIGATYSGTNTAPTNGLLVEGNVGINNTVGGSQYSSPTYQLSVNRNHTDGGSNIPIGILAYNNGSSPSIAGTAALHFQTALGTYASPSAVTTNALLGVIGFGGYDGTSFSLPNFATIQANAAQNWTTLAKGTYLSFYTTPNGSFTSAERLRIDQNGNVGIGTTSLATHRLHVSGTAGLTTGTAWTNTSDHRIKENIHTYNRGLKEILSINPVYYTYKKEAGIGNGEENIGIIAQDVEKVLPEAIMTAPITLKDGSIIQDGKHLYRADAIWFAMINAFKEQQSLINKQQKEIEELKAQNSSLKSSVEKNSSDIESLKAMILKKQN